MKQFNSAQLNIMKLVAPEVARLSLSTLAKHLALEIGNALSRPSLDNKFASRVTQTLDEMISEYLSHDTIKVVIDSAHRKAETAIELSCYELGIKGIQFFMNDVMSMRSRSWKTRQLVQYWIKEDERWSSVSVHDYDKFFKGDINHAIKRLERDVWNTIVVACTRALLTGNYQRGILDKKFITTNMKNLAHVLVNDYAPMDKPKADNNANSDGQFLIA